MNLKARKLLGILPSLTLQISQKANKLKELGHDVISLGVGEPYFDTPDHIKKAAIEAIQKGETKYTNSSGDLRLKNAIVKKYQYKYNLNYSENEIIVSSGAKQVLYNILNATLNENDEVIIPKPYWVSYPEIVKLAGGIPRFLECSYKNQFKINIESLRFAINKNTKWIIINSPNNPSGYMYSKGELLKLSKFLLKYPDIYILSDDIYEDILLSKDNFYNIAMVNPKLKDRVFIVSGVSKTYSMTGFRIGYGLGNKNLVKYAGLVQSQSTSCPCSISQIASMQALNSDQSYLKDFNNNYRNKLEIITNYINEIEGLNVDFIPKGAFYLFISCKNFINKINPNTNNIIKNSGDFVDFLLIDANVTVVPGIAFGMDDYFRISFSNSDKNLEEAMKRIKKSCKKLIKK